MRPFDDFWPMNFKCYLSYAFALAVLLATSMAGALPFEGHRIVMSVGNRYAAEVGEQIARDGGNVVDCAIAMELVMSVTNPTFGALGGGGFALVSMNGETKALDFREMAPAAMTPDYYLKKAKDASITGGASVGVPGTLAGLWALHKKYGHMPWAKLIDPAIALARHGFQNSAKVYIAEQDNEKRFNQMTRQLFLKNGKPYLPGDTIVESQLAQALLLIRNHGPTPFYNGPISRDIVVTVHGAGGDMTLQDLKSYHVVWRKPLTSNYQGYTVVVMPPPSSGGIITIRALKLFNLRPIETKLLSVDEFHYIAEILMRAFVDRTEMGDPDFTKMNVAHLTGDDDSGSKEIDKLARSIRMDHATSAKDLAKIAGIPYRPAESLNHEAKETSHMSVLDQNGNAVSMTFTLNGNFGSGVATKKFGIMLNDEMDDFTTHPGKPNMFGLVQGKANEVQPGKRPLSSMSPTLVRDSKTGKVIMALGAPGGPRIISSVIQVLYRVLAKHQDLQAAVEAPRVHHQFLPDILYYDDDRMPFEIVEGLKARGHKVEAGWQAHVFAVYNDNGVLEGVVDTRDEGMASGF